jgi:5'-nucleotidase
MANLLVTNDDGADADGLLAAVQAVAAAGHRPTVVTPVGNVSTFGTALGRFANTWHTAVPLHRDWPVDLAFTMDTYPAAIVALAAIGAFGPRPDLVVSGINHGANTGIAVVHSATVASALTAAMHGIPAIAVSADNGANAPDWPACAIALSAILSAAAGTLPVSGALNVNLPTPVPLDPDEVVWCEPAQTGTTASHLESAVRQDGQIDLRVMLRKAFPSPAENTDSGALMSGRVTLSWVAAPGTALPEADWPQRLVNRVRRQWASAHAG